MVRRSLFAFVVGVALAIAGPFGPGPIAYAQSCLSTREARDAVQSGKARTLSSMLPAIRSAVGGDVLPGPQLCWSGSRLVYLINVLSNGQVKSVTVDASNGRISGQ